MAATSSLPYFLGAGALTSADRFDVADAYFAAGGRDFDTARVYGASEATLGQWIASRGVASEVRVLTKGGHPDLETWRPRLAREAVLGDIRTSLEQLGLDSVSCYLLHRDDTSTDIGVIADTLATIVREGLAERIGVSNWSADRVSALAAALDDIDGPTISIVSNYYGLAPGNPTNPFPGCRTADEEIFSLGRRLGYRVLSWSAQSAGYFAGADRPEFDSPESRRRKRELADASAAHGVTPLAVLARWLVTADDILTPVFGTRSAEHVAELARWSVDDTLDPAVADLVAAVGESIHDPGQFA